jgi:aspartyl-tRNA(Asn)/glutamyl-tRNA(Gln) amidotransferase subunit A
MERLERISDITGAIRSGSASAVEVVTAALDRIEQADRRVNAFLTVTRESALKRAAELDSDRTRWPQLPLLGVPVAIKDNICTRRTRTTAGS